MSEIRVAVAGVGNCASALVQGLQYYKDIELGGDCVGLRNFSLGGFTPRDVKVVAAFDVDMRKVGKDLSEAIFSPPNNTMRIVDIQRTNVTVNKGPVMDGIGEYTKEIIEVSGLPTVDVPEVLRQAGAEILVILLPSGGAKAVQWYTEQALIAKCAVVNATPVFVASNISWAERFFKAGLPLVGDDLVDQVGATTIHKTLLRLLSMHGVRVSETYQLDVGGGTESLDTLARTRDIKRTVKTKSVEMALPYKAEVVAGSTDYVDFLQNRRDSYFWVKGRYFGGAPMQIDLRLSTVDAPNAGSSLLDVIRAVKIALDRKLKGMVLPISAYAFKHPARLVPPEKSEKDFADFVGGNE